MGKDANGNSILGGIVVKINLLRSAFSHLWQQPEKIPPQQDTQTPPKQQQVYIYMTWHVCQIFQAEI